MNRVKKIVFTPTQVNKKTGLFSGVKPTDIKSFIKIKIANEKKLGRIDNVLDLQKDLKKVTSWTNKQSKYAKKQLSNYFIKMSERLNTPIVKQDPKTDNFEIEIQKIKDNLVTRKIQEENLKKLTMDKKVEKFLKENKTLEKIRRKKSRTQHNLNQIGQSQNDEIYQAALMAEGYKKFDNVVRDMGGLQNAIELYSVTIDKKAEFYSVDVDLYSKIFD